MKMMKIVPQRREISSVFPLGYQQLELLNRIMKKINYILIISLTLLITSCNLPDNTELTIHEGLVLVWFYWKT